MLKVIKFFQKMFMTQHFRLFFAIPLTEEVRNTLATLQKQLQKTAWNKKIKWSHIENLHITLRFIGDATVENITELQKKSQEILASSQSFTIEFGELKLFPRAEHPRVLVIEVLPSQELFSLAKKLEDIVCDCGFTPEARAYNPHLTLGRTKSYLKLNPIELQIAKIPAMLANSFGLFNSIKSEEKLIYQNLKTFSLL